MRDTLPSQSSGTRTSKRDTEGRAVRRMVVATYACNASAIVRGRAGKTRMYALMVVQPFHELSLQLRRDMTQLGTWLDIGGLGLGDGGQEVRSLWGC